jgi:hypothetical protein
VFRLFSLGTFSITADSDGSNSGSFECQQLNAISLSSSVALFSIISSDIDVQCNIEGSSTTVRLVCSVQNCDMALGTSVSTIYHLNNTEVNNIRTTGHVQIGDSDSLTVVGWIIVDGFQSTQSYQSFDLYAGSTANSSIRFSNALSSWTGSELTATVGNGDISFDSLVTAKALTAVAILSTVFLLKLSPESKIFGLVLIVHWLFSAAFRLFKEM